MSETFSASSSSLRLFLLIPCLGLSQSMDLGNTAKLNYQGHVGIQQWVFPLKGGLGQNDFVTHGLAELDLTLSFNSKIPLEFRLHPRFNYEPDRDYDGIWGSHFPPLWLDDAYLDWFTSHFELRAGYQIFSWKTVESVSQADILNQSDRETDFFNPHKIGEPSVRARLILPSQTQNVFEFYLLPFFTPSPLPGTGSRYDFFQNTPHHITHNTDLFQYPTSEGEHLPQWALRYQTQILQPFDMTFFLFHGYRRFPLFQPLPGIGPGGALTFTHLYPPLFLGGMTFQGALGSWLWKGEAAYTRYEQELRSQSGKDVEPNLAYTGGFEYTFYSPWFQNQDLGTILEFIGDTDAGKDQADLEGFRPFRSHVFAGLRYTFNNPGDRAILGGAFFDYLEHDLIYRVEYSERLLNRLSLKAEITGIAAKPNSPFQPFEKALRAGLELKYNF